MIHTDTEKDDDLFVFTNGDCWAIQVYLHKRLGLEHRYAQDISQGAMSALKHYRDNHNVGYEVHRDSESEITLNTLPKGTESPTL